MSRAAPAINQTHPSFQINAGGWCLLAFNELLKRGVEAVYWYNQFDRPIEGKESEKIAQQIKDSKIEILVQSQGGKAGGEEWLSKVEAKFIK